MKIKELHNLREEKDNVFICDTTQGVAVCSITWETTNEIEIEDIDHCSCMSVSAERINDTIILNIITEKIPIEELIILRYIHNGDLKTKRIKLIRK